MRPGTLAAMLAVAAAPAGDRFDDTLRALARGSAAAAHDDRPRLRAAAMALRASGAAPVAGGADLAAAWQRRSGATLPVERDRALGPGYRALALPGTGAAAFAQTFLGGQRARVAVVARPGAPVALRVADDRGTTVCAIGGAPARCDWVPTYTARFRIELRNPGRAADHYLLVVE